MALGGHLQRPSGYPEGRILDPLEFEDSRGRGVGEPDGSGVGEEGTDEGLVGDEEGLQLLPPVLASQGLHDADFVLGPGSNAGDVVGEGVLGVKSDTQYPGGRVEREVGA